jgi:hypothetical protein
MRPLLATLALASLAAPAGAAEPAELLKPFAFLAGHCWRGSFADGKRTDEHCFAWTLDGAALRDTHVVRAPGQADGAGETIYFVNTASHRVEYLYVENHGGFSRGAVEVLPGALLFPDTQYVSDGESLTYRARWTPQGADGYEAWSEAQTREGWSTMFKLAMKRVD